MPSVAVTNKPLPLDSIVLETDAPDLTVSAHHGERNSPEYLPDCLASLAEVKGLDKEEVARATTENASRIFDLANI